MTPKELVFAVSSELGLSLNTIVQHDRNLLVAGLRTEGERGRGSSSINELDAARLIVAATTSRNVRDSAKSVTNHTGAIDDILLVFKHDKIGNRYVIIEDKISDSITIDIKISVAAIKRIAVLVRGE